MMRRIALPLVVAAALFTLTGFGFFHGGAPNQAVCTISATQPVLNNLTFPSGSGAGVTVGAVSVATSGSCPTPTLSIIGSNTGGFTLSGVHAPANLLTASGSSAACASDCAVTLQADVAGALNTPQSQTFTVTAPPPATCTISPSQPTLSALSFPDSSGAGVVVGAVAVAATGTCATPTLSITGSNTGGFTLSSSSAPANLLTASGSGAACGGGCSVTIQGDISGATNTPQSRTFTVTATATTTCTISSNQPLLNTTTFPGSSGAGVVVGSISVATTGTCPTAGLSITGSNPGGFTLSAATVPANLLTAAGSGTACAGSGCTLTLQTDVSGATNTPQTRTYTVTATSTSGAFLTNMTVPEKTGVTQTNVPITFGLPLSATTTVDSGSSIEVIDQDTSAALLCQEDNRASDLTPTVRFDAVSCVIPTLTANETKALKIYTITGAPATGTDISISDITSTAYDLPVSITDASGTYTASPLTGLNSGNSGWVNLTTPTVMGKWRNGGGLVTEYLVYVPFTKAGVPHPVLRAMFDVSCYKAARSAVGGGNPILSCKTDTAFENSWNQNASPQDTPYSVSMGSGGSCFSQATTTPAISLTLGNATAKVHTTLTAASALFTTNSIGQEITDGTGIAVVVGVPTSGGTVVPVNVLKSFGSTAIGSGTYSVIPIPHWYGGLWHHVCKWVPSGGTAMLAPEDGTYLGSAWNSGTLSGGPNAYVLGTGMVMNYITTPSAITNVDPATNSNPFEYQAVQIGGGTTGGTNSSYTMFIGQTGGLPQIGLIPVWEVNALGRYDANAPAAIFHNADYASTLPIGLIDSATGLTSALDNGIGAGEGDLCYGPACNGTHNLSWISTGTTLMPWTACCGTGTGPIDSSHGPEPFYLSYLLTGDWFRLYTQAAVTEMYQASTSVGYSGSQLTRLGFSQQQRGFAWFFRSLADSALLLPDSDSALVGWKKSTVKTMLSNEYTTTINTGTDQVQGTLIAGPSNGLPGNTCTSLPNSNCGWHWYYGGPGISVAIWQLGYTMMTGAHMAETGMMDSNGALTWKWMSDGLVNNALDSTDYNRPPVASSYWMTAQNPITKTQFYTPASLYNMTSMDAGNQDGFGRVRTISGSITLSGCTISTASCMITMPDKTSLGAGNSFYCSATYTCGWILSLDHVTRAVTGACQISNIDNAGATSVVTCATNAPSILYSLGVIAGLPFPLTTIPGGDYTLPGPAPGDTVGTNTLNEEYIQLQEQSALLAHACSSVWGTDPTAAANAYSYLTGVFGGITLQTQWNFAPRPGGGC